MVDLLCDELLVVDPGPHRSTVSNRLEGLLLLLLHPILRKLLLLLHSILWELLVLHAILRSHLRELLLHSILRKLRLLHSILRKLLLLLHSILRKLLRELLLLHSILRPHLRELLLLHTILRKLLLHAVLLSHLRKLLLHSILRKLLLLHHSIHWLLIELVRCHWLGAVLILIPHWLALTRRCHLIGWKGPGSILYLRLGHHLKS